MKTVVSLAILIAALLLVTNMVFASDSLVCSGQLLCYDITSIDQNGNTDSDFWEVCLNNDGTGILDSDNDGTYTLYLFGAGPGTLDTTGGLLATHLWSTWVAQQGSNDGVIQAMPPAPAAYTITGAGQVGGTTDTRYRECEFLVCSNLINDFRSCSFITNKKGLGITKPFLYSFSRFLNPHD